MKNRLLTILTRTPLHVGAGSSVGAIDQPIQRERHTGFPVIPASSLKGSFADQWQAGDGATKRLTVENGTAKTVSDAAWLFGSDTTDLPFAGSLLFSEARLLAFPIRSAKGSFAWITCPLMLQRAVRDGALAADIPAEPGDSQAIFKTDGPLCLPENRLVLEDYCFESFGRYPTEIAQSLGSLADNRNDTLFQSITERLVILSNGMMSHFAVTTCEIAQHVRISDDTGTAEGTGLFNQENVPADSLFYSLVSATRSRVPSGDLSGKSADDALEAFASKVNSSSVLQFGGDASTGLGFCSAGLVDPKHSSES